MHFTTFFSVTSLLALFQIPATFSAKCELFAPPEKESGAPELGMIFIPGAQISGELYAPLAEKLQSEFPGKLWVGLTENWWVNMPNPIQIGPMIEACFVQARLARYNIDTVFLAGHSLGGVVLESYVSNHMRDSIMGLILFGSYLPDIPSTNNTFPVPVLSAVGTLDGLTMSIAYREYKESQKYNETNRNDPVLLVEDVNHGQVASGELPSHVLVHDIDPVIDLTSAHERYAATAVTFMITARTTRALFSEDTVKVADSKLQEIRTFTDNYFEPFALMELQEDTIENGVRMSPWMIAAQLKLLGAFDANGPDLTEITVTTELVPGSDIGEVKPKVIDSAIACKNVTVTTYSHNKYLWNPLEHDHLLSTEVMKAKFKMADDVLDHLCLEYDTRWQCKDINEEAFKLARSVASEKALERYDTVGTQLVFTDDYQTWWGPGWEFDFGLKYTKVNETHTNVTSTSLIAPTYFKTHYCDLLTPFRALEWIYIGGMKHG